NLREVASRIASWASSACFRGQEWRLRAILPRLDEGPRRLSGVVATLEEAVGLALSGWLGPTMPQQARLGCRKMGRVMNATNGSNLATAETRRCRCPTTNKCQQTNMPKHRVRERWLDAAHQATQNQARAARYCVCSVIMTEPPGRI